MLSSLMKALSLVVGYGNENQEDPSKPEGSEFESSLTHDPTHGPCFKTTGIVIKDDIYLEVSHSLIDSGASSNFISKEAASRAGLLVKDVKPKEFFTCNGRRWHSKAVTFDLALGGLQHEVFAYVDDDKDAHSLLLGVPVIERFRMSLFPPNDERPEMTVSVKSDVKGERRVHYYLQRDSPGAQRKMIVHDAFSGRVLAMRPGETGVQRKARETYESKKGQVKDKSP